MESFVSIPLGGEGGAVQAYIGESVSYHIGADKDGNAIAIYEQDEDTVNKFYETWNRENNA